jgi:hypothetical protein
VALAGLVPQLEVSQFAPRLPFIQVEGGTDKIAGARNLLPAGRPNRSVITDSEPDFRQERRWIWSSLV